jgi:phosphate uptake regulator
MIRRKIQLIANSTYSTSLPKKWVIKRKLKEGREILFFEKDDGSLIISTESKAEKSANDITLNIDEYSNAIDQIIFALYYLGFENINLTSKKGFAKDVETRIRITLRHMSGTEITHEDEKTIKIRVLLDKSKVDIKQVLYRISLIIEASITSIIEGADMEEIRVNENEVDRLYHLAAKVISLSLVNSDILRSSKIENMSLIPSFLLISKKMENIADFIEDIAGYAKEDKKQIREMAEILSFVKERIKRNILYMMGNSSNLFEKTPAEKIKSINKQVESLKDKSIQACLEDIIRYIVDIEEEIINISFYKKMVSDGNI